MSIWGLNAKRKKLWREGSVVISGYWKNRLVLAVSTYLAYFNSSQVLGVDDWTILSYSKFLKDWLFPLPWSFSGFLSVPQMMMIHTRRHALSAEGQAPLCPSFIQLSRCDWSWPSKNPCVCQLLDYFAKHCSETDLIGDSIANTVNSTQEMDLVWQLGF